MRPCFLVIDREFAGSISTRKLVLETAKYNVITAYSGREALETLDRFPGVDGVVLSAGVSDIPAPQLVDSFKQRLPNLPVVVVSAPQGPACPSADYELENFNPARLIELLRQILPQQTDAILAHEAELESQP